MKNTLHECSGCGRHKALCQCAGGDAADAEKSKKDNDITANSKSDTSATNNGENHFSALSTQHITLFDEKNQLMRCLFFALPANQSAPTPSHGLQEENDENLETKSMGMGMKMGGSDE